jgi:hypothetical protein
VPTAGSPSWVASAAMRHHVHVTAVARCRASSARESSNAYYSAQTTSSCSPSTRRAVCEHYSKSSIPPRSQLPLLMRQHLLCNGCILYVSVTGKRSQTCNTPAITIHQPSSCTGCLCRRSLTHATCQRYTAPDTALAAAAPLCAELQLVNAWCLGGFINPYNVCSAY